MVNFMEIQDVTSWWLLLSGVSTLSLWYLIINMEARLADKA